MILGTARESQEPAHKEAVNRADAGNEQRKVLARSPRNRSFFWDKEAVNRADAGNEYPITPKREHGKYQNERRANTSKAKKGGTWAAKDVT